MSRKSKASSVVSSPSEQAIITDTFRDIHNVLGRYTGMIPSPVATDASPEKTVNRFPSDDEDDGTPDEDDSPTDDNAIPADVAAKYAALDTRKRTESDRLRDKARASGNKALGGGNTHKYLEFAWDCHMSVAWDMNQGFKHSETCYTLRAGLLEDGFSEANARPDAIIGSLHVALLLFKAETPDAIPLATKQSVNPTTLDRLRVCVKRNGFEYSVKPGWEGIMEDCIARKLVGNRLRDHLKGVKAEFKRIEEESAKVGKSADVIAMLDGKALTAERAKQLKAFTSAIESLRTKAMAANLSRTEIRDALIQAGLIVSADHYGPVPVTDAVANV